MVLDYGGAWLAEIVIKSIFADNRPKAIVLKGADRREKRRALEEAAAIQEGGAMAINGVDTKKSQ
jgi:cation-transporting ATPase 13A1